MENSRRCCLLALILDLYHNTAPRCFLGLPLWPFGEVDSGPQNFLFVALCFRLWLKYNADSLSEPKFGVNKV